MLQLLQGLIRVSPIKQVLQCLATRGCMCMQMMTKGKQRGGSASLCADRLGGAGVQAERAMQLFRRMDESPNVRADLLAYNAIMTAHARGGHWRAAQNAHI